VARLRSLFKGIDLAWAASLLSWGPSAAITVGVLVGAAGAASAASPADFIKNQQQAIALGKALFWDSQSGGDGVTACATCHFSEGRDRRVTNTTNPGPDGVFALTPPGGTVTAANFPVHSDDRLGSQGVVAAQFRRIVPGSAADDCQVTGSPVFGLNRQVTGRNTPSQFQAAVNIHNFWDGRANNIFNGSSPGGTADANAGIWLPGKRRGPLAKVRVAIEPASQASQAVGPPNNGVEMSCAGRTFPELGRKMLSLGQPLASQAVDPQDSVLASLRDTLDGKGLAKSYAAMVRDAFQDRYWSATTRVTLPAENGATSYAFSQMEANFSLFWGLAIQAYIETLVPHDTPYDRGELSARQQAGFEVFTGSGRCESCHRDVNPDDDFTAASRNSGGGGNAFTNSAVRPAAEDSGVQPEAIGEFKTPTVRNNLLSGPYFHNGEMLTLMQVVDFYDRGGDFRSDATDGQVRPLGLSEAEKVALVDFMISLTDERAQISAAPFDHPSLEVPNFGTVAATGAAGGAPEGPYLGANPFAH